MLGEDGGQSGECRVGTNSDPWGGDIGEDENGSDGVYVFLDLTGNGFLRGFVLQNTAGIGEPRCVDDANLRKRLSLLTTFTNAGTYHHAIITLKFVNAGRFGSALVPTLLVGGLRDFKVVVINVLAVKDIGEKR